MAWTTSLTTFRSCLMSLDDKEAWNLQVMHCMMSYWQQQLMQQNVPQFTNPAIWLQYLWCPLQLQ